MIGNLLAVPPLRWVGRGDGTGLQEIDRNASSVGPAGSDSWQHGSERNKPHDVVRDTGIEPVTSSVSGKRSPAELIARGKSEVETGIEPVCTALQAVASPLGHSTVGLMPRCTFERMTGFEPATLTLAR